MKTADPVPYKGISYPLSLPKSRYSSISCSISFCLLASSPLISLLTLGSGFLDDSLSLTMEGSLMDLFLN